MTADLASSNATVNGTHPARQDGQRPPGRARQRAYMVAAVPAGEDDHLAELGELLRTAGVATAGQLIQKVRMEAAVRRLRETKGPIAAIALDSGYSDQSAFTRQFRLTVGLSPSEYRRMFQQTPG